MRPFYAVAIAAALGMIAVPAVWAKGGAITFEMPETETGGKLTVSSTAFSPGAAIPRSHSSYDDNISPPLAWHGGSDRTKSYAVIIEDPDAPPSLPVIHWLAWNIPASVTSLPAGIGLHPAAPLEGLRQGRNSHEDTGYFGPRPPQGDQAHRYYFQVYALDTTLDLPGGATLEQLRSAMNKHVVARGEMIGLFARPDDPKHP